MQTPASILAYASLAILVSWRMYSRIRRLLGRQRLSIYRPLLTLLIFPVLIVLLALVSLPNPLNLAIFASAIAGGAALGLVGLRHTRFEVVSRQDLFYTPNAHLGIALSLLFVARLAYRFIELFVLAPASGTHVPEFAASPLTFAVIGLLAGYYLCYAAGLLRWRRSALRDAERTEASGATTSG